MKLRNSNLANETTYLKRGISPRYVDGDGITIINQKCIRDKRIHFEFSKLCDKQREIPEEKFLKRGDILINSTGKGTLGRTAQIKNDLAEPLIVDTHITIVRAGEKLDPFYLGHLISYKEPYIESLGKGSTQQLELSRTDLGEIVIEVPPLPTQRKIASILSTYDDLIENNLKRIKLLEEAARMEYKCLMRDFHDSKISRMKLKDILDLKYGKALKSDNRSGGKYPVYGSSGIVGSHEHYLVASPGIVVGRKGNVGSVFWTFENFWAIDTAYYVESKISFYFLYFNLKEQHFVNTDAAVPGLNRNFALDNFINLPSKNELMNFENRVKANFDLIHILQKQNTKLREARDILLPRLMSGEIEV